MKEVTLTHDSVEDGEKEDGPDEGSEEDSGVGSHMFAVAVTISDSPSELVVVKEAILRQVSVEDGDKDEFSMVDSVIVSEVVMRGSHM